MKTANPTSQDHTEPNAQSHKQGTESDNRKPGGSNQPDPKTEDDLDEALDETFPASDPIAPSHIDGPNN
ncbi:hypothetical protein U0C82_07305 [Fulvimarina sp. 2208YS6-2-32]|uniref:Uncharacterized protein n=1 Tax=Fulvimarina uroteuthidis TaxID=3098149 RepID=A0ABU5I456_9HYPH|nr:hypothetical protein [Fulvimarina sp. 2208YS6-2-32]MDY8108951.1 hypothetical protein [Fulvimarina sp. 2208YS6-2-32]